MRVAEGGERLGDFHRQLQNVVTPHLITLMQPRDGWRFDVCAVFLSRLCKFPVIQDPGKLQNVTINRKYEMCS